MSHSNAIFTSKQLARAAIFIALMAIGANLTAFITIGSVPLTFQTAIAILAGLILGKKLGTFAMIGYVITGLIGAPVFAGFHGGLQSVALPTFGFLLSFIAVSFIVGLLYEKVQNHNFLTYILISYVGLFVNYSIGIVHLYFYSFYVLEANQTSLLAIATSMTPFMLKDIVLVSFIASLSPKLMKAIHLSTYAKIS